MADDAPLSDNAVLPSQLPCKKKLLKVFLTIALLLFVPSGVILIGAIIFRDPIIAQVIRKAGTFFAGTQVDLKEFDSTLSGQLRLKGFSVRNPQGFVPGNAIELDEISISVDVLSLLTQTKKINHVRISGMRIAFETNLKSSNLGKILDHLKKFTSAASAAQKQENKPHSAPQQNDTSKQSSIVIGKLDTAACSVAVNRILQMPLPEIHLSDVGGHTIIDTVYEIGYRLLQSIIQTASAAGGEIGSIISGAGEQVSGIISTHGSALSGKAKKIERKIKEQKDKFLNIFKKKK